MTPEIEELLTGNNHLFTLRSLSSPGSGGVTDYPGGDYTNGGAGGGGVMVDGAGTRFNTLQYVMKVVKKNDQCYT